MMLNKKSERLYLSKGDKNIYVDTCDLPQHQIDGIRFLYRQYRKKTPGIIMNDPSGYGKTLQVALFLNAVHSLLDKPVLILCDEQEAQNWMEHFQMWTKLCDKVKIQATNPYRKDMMVCINKMVNLPAFSTRDWSIIVVDSETPKKHILKVGFKANCKIWITSVDMKSNIQMFSQVYNWLYPKDMISPMDLVANKSFADIIEKAILLDSFMEDVVLRRYDFSTPFKMQEGEPEKETKQKIKNKDATGTKIKRSKRKSDDSSSTTEEVKKEPAGTDIESFIRDQKPLESDALEECNMQIVNASQSTVENNPNITDYSLKSNDDNDISVKRKRTIDTEAELVEVNVTSNNDPINAVTESDKPTELLVSTQSEMLLEEIVYVDQKSIESETSDGNGSKNEIDFNISNIQKIEETPESKAEDAVPESNVDLKDSSANVKDIKANVDTETSKGHKTIEEMMTEMENKVLKKFKGSLLDNIF